MDDFVDYDEWYQNLSPEEQEVEDEFVETLDHWEYLAHIGMIDAWEI